MEMDKIDPYCTSIALNGVEILGGPLHETVSIDYCDSGYHIIQVYETRSLQAQTFVQNLQI